MSSRNSKTLNLLKRVISNPKKFSKEWLLTNNELIRARQQLIDIEEHLTEARQRARRLGMASDGCLDSVTATQAIGWAVSPDGEPPLLALTIDGKKVMEFRPSLPTSDLDGRFATAALAFAIPIEVVADAEVAVTDLAGRHLRGSPATPRPPGPAAQGPDALNRMLDEFRAEVRARKGRLLEVGSRARSGHTYRDLFPSDIEYVGLDVAEGPNVDVVGDAHTLSHSLQGQFDFAFSISTFEHLLMPWVAALELNKVMKPGGLVFIQSHQTWPVHEEPWDFWRYSVDGWRGLFNFHTGFELVNAAYGQPASIRPLAPNPITVTIPHCDAFLLSGCVARKIGNAIVRWEGDVSKVFDLNYSH